MNFKDLYLAKQRMEADDDDDEHSATTVITYNREGRQTSTKTAEKDRQAMGGDDDEHETQ